MIDRVMQENRLAAVAQETARRRQTDGFSLYRPRPEMLPFHTSEASERVALGGNRAGKTVVAAAEMASAILQRPIRTWEGELIPLGWPTDRPLFLWFIGYDTRHLARMYKKLFRPGLFKVIKDRDTGHLRAWKPWEPDDLAREREVRNAPPLIDERYIQDIAWENKAERVPAVIRFKTGTEIIWMTSGGEAGVGDAVDGIWIDEDVQIPDHVSEWQARLADNRGRLVWSSWPKGTNMALRQMVRRAEEQEKWPNPDVQCWRWTFSGNPYIPADRKEKILRGWAAAGEGMLAARDLGHFADGLILVFPSFDIDKHGIPSKSPSRVERAVRATQDMLPRDWSYYLSVDPGFAHASVVVGMVPPPWLGDALVVREAFYFARQNAEDQIATVAAKYGHILFQAFLIDSHAAATMPGRGETQLAMLNR